MPRREGSAMSLEAIQRYNETLLETLGEDAGLRDLDALREGVPRATLRAWLGDFSPPEAPCWEDTRPLSSVDWFPVLEKYLKDRSNHFEVNLELNNRSNLVDFVATVRALGIRIEDIESNPAYLNSGLSVFSVSFTVNSAELKKYKNHEEIIAALQSLEYVHYIEEL